MKNLFFSLLLFFAFTSCTNSQTNKKQEYRMVGSCEGCEAVFEYGNRKLSNSDTLPDFKSGEKKIKITGTIYKPDGKTPAPGVILYIYHTNEQGVYPPESSSSGWGRRHGYIRGWIKTGADGKYSFFSFWPAVYPTQNAPAHIHPTILEPDGKYYWINEILFEGDELIPERDRQETKVRGGGNAILTMRKEDNMWVGERDIILGKNVPGYK
jgi:protocatechuate 3,4-dioxygenase beta subunit